MRHFLSKAIPPFNRVLFVESGSRQLLENLLNGLYGAHPEMNADLVTCYAGVPRLFKNEGRVYRVTDYTDSQTRRGLYAQLAANRYAIIGIICSAEPIMTKWKWMLAARLRAKVFILNENGDYFWFDRGHSRTIRRFVLFRAGLSGAGAVRTLARLVAISVHLVYLILFAASVHLRRKFRTL